MPDKRLSPVYYNKMKFAESHISDAKRLLDVGCGEGGYFHIYEKSGIDYSGIDPDASVVKKSSRVKIASAEKIPFPDNCFDTVVCMDVVEHVNSPNEAISEMRRVLKKNGKLVISVPSARYPWSYDPLNAFLRLFGNHHLTMGMWAWGHRRLYKREDFIGLLQSHGFNVELLEENTHGFVLAFLSYIPYLSVYVGKPILRKVSSKKSDIAVSGSPVEGGFIFKVFNALNKIDQKCFGKSHGLTICAVARKT